MVCKDYFEIIPDDDIDKYFEKAIGKVFACLKIYEKSNGDYEQLTIYINRLVLEFKGFYNLYDFQAFISLVSTLNGICENIDNINHQNMKSSIFYCIDTIKKGRSLK